VYLYDIRAKKEYNVTQSPWNETSAQISADGKTVVFASNRDGAQNQLFAVSLARLTEDPNDPLVRERLRRAAGGRGGRGAVGGADSVSGPLSISVDTKGIDRRAIQLTRGTTGVGSWFLSRDGRTVFYAVGGGGGGGGRGGRGGGGAADNSQNGLYSVSLDGRDRRRIASGTFAGMQPTADRRVVYFRGQVRTPTDEDTPQGRGGAAPVGFPIERLTLGAGTPVSGAGGGRAAAGAGGAAGER
jgi:hypothetical protein